MRFPMKIERKTGLSSDVWRWLAATEMSASAVVDGCPGECCNGQQFESEFHGLMMVVKVRGRAMDVVVVTVTYSDNRSQWLYADWRRQRWMWCYSFGIIFVRVLF
ncbi:hypothetical protein Hanom_Chr16g01449471 [Helianthus anomalus]